MMRIRRKKEAKKNLLTLLVILALAAVIFSVDAIGSFMAQRVISPVMNYLNKNTGADSDMLRIEAFSCYACDRETASSPGDDAFWVQRDDGYHCLERVSATKPESNAFLSIAVEAFSVRVTGSKEQIAATREAFLCLAAGARELITLSDSLSLNDVTRSETLQRSSALSERAEAAAKGIRSLSDSNTTVVSLKNMLSDALAALHEIPSADTSTYSSDFYRAACTYCWRYGEFLQKLKAQ